MTATHEQDAVLAGLSRAEALELTQRGGTVRCIGVPPGVEFGIDLRVYAVGPLFGGVKMVPTTPVHLVTWGTELSCCGVFVSVRPSEVCVMRWDAQAEALEFERDEAEAQRQTKQVEQMEHDASLAPYPLATQEQWAGLSGYISERVLRRAAIPLGTVTAPAGIDQAELDMEIERMRRRIATASSEPEPVPVASEAVAASSLEPKPVLASVDPETQSSTEPEPLAAVFVSLEPRTSGGGRSGSDLSSFHLDRSHWLDQLLTTEYATPSGQADQPTNLGGAPAASAVPASLEEARLEAAAELAFLGELQLSFVLFLRLSSLRALEQWKAMLHLLSHCDTALSQRPRLYSRVVAVLRAQLSTASADFFETGDGEEHFVRASLARLAENASGASLAAPVAEELRLLWEMLESSFGLTPDGLVADAFDEDDEPVVVAES